LQPSEKSIFHRTRLRHEIGQIEFSYFRQRAISRVPEICTSIPRFDDLRREFSFWIDKGGGDDHLQINFGTRKMWARGLDGGTVPEKGPSLVYSLSPVDGTIATVLYPATSSLGSVREDHIFLRIGNYSGMSLEDNLRSDLKDLVAYTFVSSLELNPSISDRLRFWWLRTTHPHSLDSKFFRPLTPNAMMASASKFTLTSLLIALLRPLGFALAYVLLVYLGLVSLADHLRW
jgi:hypothetical protein